MSQKSSQERPSLLTEALSSKRSGLPSLVEGVEPRRVQPLDEIPPFPDGSEENPSVETSSKTLHLRRVIGDDGVVPTAGDSMVDVPEEAVITAKQDLLTYLANMRQRHER